MMKGFRLVTGAAALAILLGQSSQVFGYAAYDGWGSYNLGDYSSYGEAEDYVHYNSAGGGVWTGLVIENGKSYSAAYGYADAGSLKQGVHGWAVSTPTNTVYTDSRMSTEAANRFTVLPGNSGLDIDDKTTLQLNIRLDGTLHGEATSYPGAGWSHADMKAGLSIYDYSIVECGEGCGSPAQASFGASSELEAYDVTPIIGREYTYFAYWEDSWDISSNSGDDDSHDASWSETQQGDAMHYEAGHYFDTGELTLEFQATVGHTLDIESYIYTYVNANYDGEAWADFSNTFALGLTSADGAQIVWEVGGSQPVPLPGALPLLGSGLLGLFGLRRRQARKQK
ncbi:MAG: hypothetical protein M0P70_06225 [Desulfobulbaceae bacterium]|nr:hypothetical protein [Desulfobulbaceae bacterium]